MLAHTCTLSWHLFYKSCDPKFKASFDRFALLSFAIECFLYGRHYVHQKHLAEMTQTKHIKAEMQKSLMCGSLEQDSYQ